MEMNSNLRIIPCMDSIEMGELRRQELDLPRITAAELGRSAVEAARSGYYYSKTGEQVDWSSAVQAACAAKISTHQMFPFFGRMTVRNSTVPGSCPF